MTANHNAEERAWEQRTAARYEDLELHPYGQPDYDDKHFSNNTPESVRRWRDRETRDYRSRYGAILIGVAIVILAGIALWLAAGGWR